MNLCTDLPPRTTLTPQGRRLQLGGQSVMLDRGHVAIVTWPNAAALTRQVAALCELPTPVVRYAGGTLINDLSLQDNLMLEPALHDGVLPGQLLPEIGALFAAIDRPIRWSSWATTWPDAASLQALMQVRIGRALVADPDLLLIDATQWDDGLLQPACFSRCFIAQHPWRTLVWATHDAARANVLREALCEVLQESLQETIA
ncbi:MAG: hypothetical protein H7228_06405 [Polaromonas sp.]|nr:hypothetical protein [Polaromonas sp.]